MTLGAHSLHWRSPYGNRLAMSVGGASVGTQVTLFEKAQTGALRTPGEHRLGAR
jgi:hypothetical protein